MNKKSKFAILIVLVFSLVLSSAVTSFAASGTKRMTVYNQVIKSGKYAYCATPKGIYKVNLKTKQKKLIAKDEVFEIYPPGEMKLHKGYIYYTTGGGTSSDLCRVRTDGKKHRSLHSIWNYAIKNNRIYFTDYDYDNGNPKGVKRSMTLNGKSVKKSPYKISNKIKKSNKKGYRVTTNTTVLDREYDYYSGDVIVTENTKYYLVTPDKTKIKLCSIKTEFYE